LRKVSGMKKGKDPRATEEKGRGEEAGDQKGKEGSLDLQKAYLSGRRLASE